MKLRIQYWTKEKKWKSPDVYSPGINEAELSPIRIIRRPCGDGAASSRYHYEADFLAPDDASSVHEGVIRANIFRKLNPHFNPKKLTWADNIAALEKGV